MKWKLITEEDQIAERCAKCKVERPILIGKIHILPIVFLTLYNNHTFILNLILQWIIQDLVLLYIKKVCHEQNCSRWLKYIEELYLKIEPEKDLIALVDRWC